MDLFFSILEDVRFLLLGPIKERIMSNSKQVIAGLLTNIVCGLSFLGILYLFGLLK